MAELPVTSHFRILRSFPSDWGHYNLFRGLPFLQILATNYLLLLQSLTLAIAAKSLTRPRIIKEEPNSAQRRVPPYWTGPGACRTFWPQRGETNKCICTKSARTSSGLIRQTIYPAAPILYEVRI